MAEIISHHSGQALERVERDIDPNYYMSADDARVRDHSTRRSSPGAAVGGLAEVDRRRAGPGRRQARR